MEAYKGSGGQAEDLKSEKRRQSLRLAIAAALGVTVLPKMLDKLIQVGEDSSSRKRLETSALATVNNESASDIENVLQNGESLPTFANEVAGYKAEALLRKDEILFLDGNNRPVGKPVRFREFVDYKTKNGQAELHKYTPGTLNAGGIPENGIVTEWMDYVQKMHQEKYPDCQIADRCAVVNDFNSAYDLGREPELATGIECGKIIRFIDIIEYFANKPVPGQGLSRKDYVLSNLNFSDESGLPEEIALEVKRLVLGLCAHESKFDNNVSSKKEARGVFQFVPDTANAYAKNLSDFYASIPQQVAAFNEFIPDLWKQVKYHMGEEAFSYFKERFSSEATFLQDFMTPLIISGYNVGAARVGEAVRLYCIDEHKRIIAGEITLDMLPQGKELFLAIADFAKESDVNDLKKYGSESREYVLRVYAKTEALTEVERENKKTI
ncbi:transglycosylase SLT domain-containing protein [Candidatus Nomurabacteria bacterium]|nr:transglycosylase SLT domain-containing protein [Candidatus Kaiserbacteria bacterium]MCB9814199.1 transglycosylase SLT domain-containing protein [Candidatus Nomurabacteria bacterium]